MTTKLLVLGASGMLGNAMYRVLATSPDYEVVGSVRSASTAGFFPPELRAGLRPGIDVENFDAVLRLASAERPKVIINCIGLVKQLADAEDPLAALPVNAILPHRLARIAGAVGARLVHVSTDCVFSGAKGGYVESDLPDARDLYGRSKLLGEVDYENAVTLRTSIIGHELGGSRSLVGWFLAQKGPVKGFRRAVFSGLPTCELATVIRDHVLPDATIRGLWHVSAEPINKFALLELISEAYGRSTEIVPDDQLTIDRSLNSTRFRERTGYVPPPWPELVRRMAAFG